MDKIQAAIAKARSARSELRDDRRTETVAPAVAEPAPQPVAPPPTGEADAAWQELASFAPPAKKMARARIVTFGGGAKEPGAMAMDMLRTKVLHQMRVNGWKRLAITSPGAHCGKSTVTLNLAFSLARQPNLRTIVAEMDLRRPSLAKILGAKGSASFSTVLDGKSGFAEAAVRPRPNLAVAVNHGPARNPAELLQSPGIGPALTAIEATYAPSLMIFDMPPMLVSDDAIGFMGHVDCVLLVAAAGSTTLREIDVCERDLAEQTNVVGVVLNKCRYIEKGTGSYGADGYY